MLVSPLSSASAGRRRRRFLSLFVASLLLAALGLTFQQVVPSALAATDGPSLTVDVAAGRHAISPDIYGMNFPDAALAKELDLPIARNGGNATSRYNWQVDATNRGSD